MPPKFAPPANWRQLYGRLELYREELQAPVDTIGCHCLKDPKASKEAQRFHTLVALMLSAQTKDVVTAAAMDQLLKVGLTPESVSAMPPETLDAYICKVGFHNNKTKYIKQVASILQSDYGGKVPRDYDQLIALPGVGPKMAHLFFQDADGRVLGIGVDTHVHRISQRFHWVPSTVKTPEDTRKALEAWLPKDKWTTINHLLVGLGQTVCTPLSPHCAECKLNDVCPNAFKEKIRLRKKTTTSRSPSQSTSRTQTSESRQEEKTVADIESLVQSPASKAASRSSSLPARKKAKTR